MYFNYLLTILYLIFLLVDVTLSYCKYNVTVTRQYPVNIKPLGFNISNVAKNSIVCGFPGNHLLHRLLLVSTVNVPPILSNKMRLRICSGKI